MFMINLEYLIILILATCFLYLVVKNKDKIGKFLHVLDIPTEGKIHKKITPLIGSFPIFFFSLFLLVYFNSNKFDLMTIIIFVYSYVFFFLGYIDDRFKLNAYLKLGISLLIILFVLNSFEILQIKKIYIQSVNKQIMLGKISLFFSALCILLLMNSLNLSDGINGLASGFASLWLLILSFLTSEYNTFILLLILSSFMIINTVLIIKGNYFLGDSGSLFLGSLVGFLTIFIYNNQIQVGNFISIEKIFVFFMIPGIDMFRLFCFRLLKKKDPFNGDLNHLHHLLIKKFTINQTLLIYLFAFLSTNISSYYEIISPTLVIIFYLAIYVFFIFFSEKKLKNTSH